MNTRENEWWGNYWIIIMIIELKIHNYYEYEYNYEFWIELI